MDSLFKGSNGTMGERGQISQYITDNSKSMEGGRDGGCLESLFKGSNGTIGQKGQVNQYITDKSKSMAGGREGWGDAWTPFSRIATGRWDIEDKLINILPIIQRQLIEGGMDRGCLDSFFKGSNGRLGQRR